MQSHYAYVNCPFGENIIADIKQEFFLRQHGDDIIDLGVTSCIGFWTVEQQNLDRQYHQLSAKAGTERQFADSLATLCRNVWKQRIIDICRKHAEVNELLCCGK